MSDSAVWCYGCAEWRPAMGTSGGDVWLRVRALCVAGIAGVRCLRGELVEDYRAQVLARARGRQARVTTVRGCAVTLYILITVWFLPFTRTTHTSTQHATVSSRVTAGRQGSQGGALEASRTPVADGKIAAACQP